MSTIKLGTLITTDEHRDAIHQAIAPVSSDEEVSPGQGDAGSIALLRCLPTRELEAAYRLAKADETDKGQHSACLIGRELIRWA